MGVIAEGILRGCQGLFTPVSLGYPLSVFNKNSTLKETKNGTFSLVIQGGMWRCGNLVKYMQTFFLRDTTPENLRKHSQNSGILVRQKERGYDRVE